MAVLAGVVYLVVTLALIALTLLMILRIGFGRLESRIGIDRDGPRRGSSGPVWRLPDIQGVMHESPSGNIWQLLLFADHSLASFPELVSGINRMQAGTPDLEVVILARRTSKLGHKTAETLHIEVPIVLVEEGVYARYNVRVMPFGVLLDRHGKVRWASVANYEAQLLEALRRAREGTSQDHAVSLTRGMPA